MNITFDLATVLVVGTALAIGCLVYRWMAPATGTMSTTTKGERLVAAVTAAAAAVAIGAYAVNGIKSVEPPSERPAPGPTATRIGEAP
ncbi:hypothetical protein JCM4814A_79190 [Streptomyces phaeofaciens JCM 4814]|uniref:Uncharacterized protein n=1 Tax=Streptomyces phaeofaciens TaxID=68254 RepID=A0A918HPX8_9ACTN|nr:hypothetical protein [Streptomyces phaeofaciens]GGT92803.1 hypothetical protein GCM10010226_83450 [Streptomyces phaeofaciens]